MDGVGSELAFISRTKHVGRGIDRILQLVAIEGFLENTQRFQRLFTDARWAIAAVR